MSPLAHSLRPSNLPHQLSPYSSLTHRSFVLAVPLAFCIINSFSPFKSPLTYRFLTEVFSGYCDQCIPCPLDHQSSPSLKLFISLTNHHRNCLAHYFLLYCHFPHPHRTYRVRTWCNLFTFTSPGSGTHNRPSKISSGCMNK